MQKQEFEERIERTVTDEQYKVIEEVYMSVFVEAGTLLYRPVVIHVGLGEMFCYVLFLFYHLPPGLVHRHVFRLYAFVGAGPALFLDFHNN